MEILAFSLNATLPVVLCMAVGYLLRALKMLDDHTINQVSGICFTLFLPSLLFSNIHSIDFSADFSPKLLLYTLIAILAVVVILVSLFFAITRDLKKTVAWAQVGYRSNYLMFGLAIAQNMYGAAGVNVASMLVPVAVVLYNLVTVLLFSITKVAKDQSIGRKVLQAFLNVLKNPLIIASLLAFLFVFTPLPLPSWGLRAVNNLGAVASPLCLVILGAQIDWRHLRQNMKTVSLMTATRLVFVPVAVLIPAILMGFRGPELGALFVLFASPCANSCTIMAQQYDIYPQLTGQVVMLTTTLSGFTIFLGITLLRYLQLF